VNYGAKFVAALLGMLTLVLVVSRELFLFTVFRNSQGFLDSQGGRYHLWLALSAGLAACIAGALMFHSFLGHERTKWTRILQVPVGTLLNAISVRRSSPSPATYIAGTARSVLLNPELSEGQPDDRRPMDGSVAESIGPPSSRRTLARRAHQLSFKKWSQARHD
jgi:hypothetical protein